MGNLGLCATRIDGEGDDVQVNCIGTHAAPSCFTAYLIYVPTGMRNPEVHNCDPAYAPFTGKFWPDALNRSGGELPFFDRSGLTHYPVDGSKVNGSSLIIETYVASDHFVRRILVSNVRLSNFLGAASTGTAQL